MEAKVLFYPDKRHHMTCPVHGTIHLSAEEMAIVNNRYFQRLHYLHQLGIAYLILSGATHSRFSHSLGAFHIASLYAQHLFPTDQRRQSLAKVSALLHDIAHGPYSHAWDEVVYAKIFVGKEKGHDEQRHILISQTELRGLIEACGVNVEDVSRVWRDSDDCDHVVQAIVQGAVGADRLDFLQRDALHVGIGNVGKISVERLVTHSGIVLVKSPQTNDVGGVGSQTNDVGVEYLAFHQKVVDDIQQVLNSRFQMYHHVYYNKTVIAADHMLKHILKEASKKASGDKALDFVGASKDIAEFHRLTEHYVLGLIQQHGSDESKRLLELLLVRQIPKTITTEENRGDFRLKRTKHVRTHVGTEIRIEIPNQRAVQMKHLEGKMFFISHDGVTVLCAKEFFRESLPISYTYVYEWADVHGSDKRPCGSGSDVRGPDKKSVTDVAQKERKKRPATPPENHNDDEESE